MNKKVYIQPQVWTVSTYAECSAPLITGSTRTDDLTGGDEAGVQNGGGGGKNDMGSKEHFNDFDSWDSWD